MDIVDGMGPGALVTKTCACYKVGFPFGVEMLMEAYPDLVSHWGQNLKGAQMVAPHVLGRIASTPQMGLYMLNLLRDQPRFWLDQSSSEND